MDIKHNGKPTFWSCHTPNLLKEVANNNHIGPAAIALDILGKILFVLADKAVEINDEELNSLMCRLTLYSTADPENKADFDPAARRLIHKWDKKFLERLNK